MCKKRFIYLDNSNVWIEGRYHSAVSNGTACDVQEAHDMGIYDMHWRHDFGKLIEVASESNVMSVMAAVMVGSRPPEKDSLWKTAEAAGFKTEIMDRNSAGREKGIDSKFVIKIMEDLLTGKIGEKDCVVIVAGDADYVPIAEKIKEMKRELVVVFWNNISKTLKEKADRYINLNEYQDEIRWEYSVN